MKGVKRVLQDEPVLITGALSAVLNFLILVHVLVMSVEAVAGANIAVAAVVALLRGIVTPTRQVIATQASSSEPVVATPKAQERFGLTEGEPVAVTVAPDPGPS